MLKCMPKDTIFFIAKDYSRAYDYKYYRENCNHISTMVRRAEKIFYKVKNDSNSWIKYKEAMQNLTGSYEARINEALNNPAFRLSSDLTELPQCIYTDYDGYEHRIPPNDGKMIGSYWIDREDIVQDYPEIELITRDNRNIHELDLKVTFNWDVSDALISLNTFFYDYEQLSHNEILYRNIGEELPRFFPLNKHEESEFREKTYYESDISVIKWAGVQKAFRARAVLREGNIIEFDRELDKNCFVFYNGMYYRHSLDNNELISSNRIILHDIDPQFIEEIDLSLIHAIKFISNDGNDIIKKYEVQGLNNYFPNEVHFPIGINNSMITCEGRDVTYLVKDKYSIEYPLFNNGLGGELDSNSDVYAVSLYAGIEGMGAGYEIGYNPDSSFDIMDGTVGKVETVKSKMNDYSDFIVVDENQTQEGTSYPENVFKLEFKPIANTVRLVINGVRYEEGVHFAYNQNENTITWLFTPARGGFVIKQGFKVVAVYDFVFLENGIQQEEIDEFMREYTKYLVKMELGY